MVAKISPRLSSAQDCYNGVVAWVANNTTRGVERLLLKKQEYVLTKFIKVITALFFAMILVPCAGIMSAISHRKSASITQVQKTIIPSHNEIASFQQPPVLQPWQPTPSAPPGLAPLQVPIQQLRPTPVIQIEVQPSAAAVPHSPMHERNRQEVPGDGSAAGIQSEPQPNIAIPFPIPPPPPIEPQELVREPYLEIDEEVNEPPRNYHREFLAIKYGKKRQLDLG